MESHNNKTSIFVMTWMAFLAATLFLLYRLMHIVLAILHEIGYTLTSALAGDFTGTCAHAFTAVVGAAAAALALVLMRHTASYVALAPSDGLVRTGELVTRAIERHQTRR